MIQNKKRHKLILLTVMSSLIIPKLIIETINKRGIAENILLKIYPAVFMVFVTTYSLSRSFFPPEADPSFGGRRLCNVHLEQFLVALFRLYRMNRIQSYFISSLLGSVA